MLKRNYTIVRLHLGQNQLDDAEVIALGTFEANPLNVMEAFSQYVTSDPEANLSFSMRAKASYVDLLKIIDHRLGQTLELVTQAVSEVNTCLNINPQNILSRNHTTIVDWVLADNNYAELVTYQKTSFLKLGLLSKLRISFTVDNPDTSKVVHNFQQIIETIAGYVETDNITPKHQIQDYRDCLEQQYECKQFIMDKSTNRKRQDIVRA